MFRTRPAFPTSIRSICRFTIIELLVVIIIIGILSELVYVVGGRIRERSRIATTKILIQNIHLALTKVYEDNYSTGISISGLKNRVPYCIGEGGTRCGNKDLLNTLKDEGNLDFPDSLLLADGTNQYLSDPWGHPMVIVFSGGTGEVLVSDIAQQGWNSSNPIRVPQASSVNASNGGSDTNPGVWVGGIDFGSTSTNQKQSLHCASWDIWSAGPDGKYYNLIPSDAYDYEKDYADHDLDGEEYTTMSTPEEKAREFAEDKAADPDSDNITNWKAASSY